MVRHTKKQEAAPLRITHALDGVYEITCTVNQLLCVGMKL